MRMRKKKNLLPRMERCAALQIKDPIAHRGHWRELMPEARELRVELGCGKGRFTAGTAAAEPDLLFVAVEMVPDAMVVAMERCAAEGLRNVRFIDANANILPEFFAPGEVDRIYINFCDPWPTKRHAKRRLTSRQFFERYDKILAGNGVVEFKTDNDDLFAFSMEEVAEAGWTLDAHTFDLHHDPVLNEGNIMTEYEEKFSSLGHPIHKLIARRSFS